MFLIWSKQKSSFEKHSIESKETKILLRRNDKYDTIKLSYKDFMSRQIKAIGFCFLLFLSVFPKPVHAYLDPGTGSYILQIAAAALFGALFFIRSWWGGLKHFILGLFGRKDGKTSEKSSHKSK